MEPTRADWSILTRTKGGSLGFLRNLTLQECMNIWQRLDQRLERFRPTTASEAGAHYANYPVNPSILVQIEVFGPEGWNADEVKEWPRLTA